MCLGEMLYRCKDHPPPCLTVPDIDKGEADSTCTQPANEGGGQGGQHGQVDVPGQVVTQHVGDGRDTYCLMNWCSPVSKYLHMSE